MIFRKNNKISKNKIINNIKEIFKMYNIEDFDFNKNESSSYCSFTQQSNIYYQNIEIGIKDLSYFNDNWIFVKKIVEVFHEIEHFHQHKDLYNFLNNWDIQLSQKQLEVCLALN